MKKRELQVNIYPTSAPSTEELLYEVETLEEVCQTCEKLHLERQPLGKCVYEQVNKRFSAMFEVMTAVHHLEISILSGELSWERVLQELAVLLPQFAWLSCKTEVSKNHRRVYYMDFVPIAYSDNGFPFEIQLQTSIQQQLFYSEEEAVRALSQEIEEQLLEKNLWLSEKADKGERSRPAKKARSTKKPAFSREAVSVENQLLVYKEEIKRSDYTKERMRIANEKLELLIEKLEQTVVDCGISYLRHSDEDKEASKYLHISLREYSYLKQKAKYLEKLWDNNKALIKQTEKLVPVGSSVTYKHKQVAQLKEMIFDSDIYLVMDECREIDSRAIINQYPWFRNPYVKLMRADYHSLAKKAAYFDLLQGENYFLRKMIHKEESKKETP
ncbi:hypothetical protein [Enterococcus larvae]|uniref:hypothetical protein n=1 Tax=Enterococcus larvae TaxID=2794352 RepID=UPI003F2ED12E